MSTTGERSRLGRRFAGTVIGVTVAVGTIAAARTVLDDERSPRPAAASARFSGARDTLCTAAATVRRGDVAAARVMFFGQTHDRLHMLAADTAERSRPAAARLLEAKAKVEGAFDPPAATLAEDLDALAAATGQATSVVGGIDPGPCPR